MKSTSLTSASSLREPKKHGSWHDTALNNNNALMQTDTTCGGEKSTTHQATKFGYGLPYGRLAYPKSFCVVISALTESYVELAP